jgi:hypothetical protein
MKPANDAPMRRARAIVERVAVLLEDCHALQLDSEALLQTNDRARVEAERMLYAMLVSAIETGLIRTMEEVLVVLRLASQPLGPMGAEWLERQEQKLKSEKG